MTNVTDRPMTSSSPPAYTPVRKRYFEMSAFWTLFWLTLRQQFRARRVLILGFLFFLPSLIAILVRSFDTVTDQIRAELEFGLIMHMIPHALAPLAALLFASGMIQDELEEQTLTYLLVRPLPKWAIYFSKLLATILLTSLLTAFFVFIAYVAIFAGTPRFTEPELLGRSLKVAALMAFTLVGYCSLFGCISIYFRRSLVAGIAYIIIFEGVLANIDFAVRLLTLNYYFRVLVLRWPGISWRAMSDAGSDEWSIDLAKSPTAITCTLTVGIASLVLASLAAFSFSTREFHVKTPERS